MNDLKYFDSKLKEDEGITKTRLNSFIKRLDVINDKLDKHIKEKKGDDICRGINKMRNAQNKK